ncbi:hypothetical protein SAMD00023353_8400230 [Rosellinia necatrix]|uniref:Uncharacterized protein n=1 Tax=Rosellinia necatrix TaxID=77044 RepID=A0A1W2TW88_ROSNE|nr:hypothetical protein SAMD00023353_8400230 [Rosellinia necatrix]
MTVDTRNPPIANYASAISLTSPNTLTEAYSYDLPDLTKLEIDATLDKLTGEATGHPLTGHPAGPKNALHAYPSPAKHSVIS